MTDSWRSGLSLVAQHARCSPDPSSQNAAALCDEDRTLLGATLAVNEFPAGVAYTSERWERPLKYSVIEHAERNAIFAAAKTGIRTDGLTMVCLWAACPDCARAIIQAGLRRLVTLRPSDEGAHVGWDDGIRVAMGMLTEAGVEVVYVDGPLGVTVRRNGKELQC